ncbi:MAG: heme exporter protein CcmD [Alphaproteobacteria bacterium]|nr:heme exporter protein CcmD [Alphaproteobacteria bacterium]
MGGFWMYVWPSYALTIIVMGLNILAAYWPKNDDANGDDA